MTETLCHLWKMNCCDRWQIITIYIEQLTAVTINILLFSGDVGTFNVFKYLGRIVLDQMKLDMQKWLWRMNRY